MVIFYAVGAERRAEKILSNPNVRGVLSHTVVIHFEVSSHIYDTYRRPVPHHSSNATPQNSSQSSITPHYLTIYRCERIQQQHVTLRITPTLLTTDCVAVHLPIPPHSYQRTSPSSTFHKISAESMQANTLWDCFLNACSCYYFITVDACCSRYILFYNMNVFTFYVAYLAERYGKSDLGLIFPPDLPFSMVPVVLLSIFVLQHQVQFHSRTD